MEPLNTLSRFDSQAKQNALIAYVLMTVGLFTGIFWLLGAFWAWVKREDASGSIYYDHYSNMITVFWAALLLGVVAGVLGVLWLGWLVSIPVWLWSAFRMFSGLFKLLAGNPYNDQY